MFIFIYYIENVVVFFSLLFFTLTCTAQSTRIATELIVRKSNSLYLDLHLKILFNNKSLRSLKYKLAINT